MSLLLYLGKVLVASALLFGYYRLFLRNRQFHHYNRFYLLGALVLSVVLPLCRIPVISEPHSAMSQVVYRAADVLTVDYGEDQLAGAANSGWQTIITIRNGLYLLYALGIGLLLIQVGRSLAHIHRITRRYPAERVNHLKFYNTREPGTPFSFFRSVFWNEQLPFNSVKGQQIFRHELFHIQQKHSFDILVAEVLTAVFWINPLFHLIKRELRAIHEFLADQYAASGSDRYAYAELLVQQTLETRQIPMTHPFFQNHIKRRIAMITQLKQPKYRYWSRVMILPLAVLLFGGIALYARQPMPNQLSNDQPFLRSTESVTIVVDPGHGGSDNGAMSTDGKLAEKDLNLQIGKQLQQLAQQYNINVVLTREGDYLPGNATEVKEGLTNRTNLVNSTNAKLFVSLHVSAAGPNARKNYYGMELFISNNNEATAAQSAQLGSIILGKLNQLYTVNPVVMKRKEQGIWVLDKVPVPAVLIECGYMTWNKDIQFLTNEENQRKVARSILQGIADYLNAGATTSYITDTVPVPKNKVKAATEQEILARIEQEKKRAELMQKIARKKQELETLQQELTEQEVKTNSQKEHEIVIAKLIDLKVKSDTEHEIVLQKLRAQHLEVLQKEQADQEVIRKKILLQLKKESENQLNVQKKLQQLISTEQQQQQTRENELLLKKLNDLKKEVIEHKIDSVQ